MEELWRPVYGFVGFYEMSTRGCVRSVTKGLIVQYKMPNGYLQVVLNKDGVSKHCYVHRLVAMTFPDLVDWTEDAKGRPFEELQINHKDKNKKNNRVENLEWCDCPYNIRYSQAKTVYQYTLDGELVKVWRSTMECEIETGINHRAISACCLGKRNKHKGFKWSYLPLSN